MRRNCLYKYLQKNRPHKDIVIYQYKNPQEYLIQHIGNSCYKTYSLFRETTEEIKDNNLLSMIWLNSNILAEYEQDGVLYLQVNFNK